MRTVAAITTPLITSAIHIIRISGPETFNVLNKIIKKPVDVKPYSIQRNLIIDKDKIIDDVLLNVFVAPKSFTGEHSVEINCHGSNLVTKKILDLLILNGCELANPGEFSMQALINKKMDYAQIEAMNNFIHANSELSNNMAFDAMSGKWSKKLTEIRNQIFKVTGSIEVNIDYPEYDDVPEYTNSEIIDIILPLSNELQDILDNSKKILPIFEGVKVSIIGEPNVGKSSLLNFLSKQEKSIVTDIKGTTRDIIESQISFSGIPIKLLDTAGIRSTNDEVETIGINKSKQTVNEADLIIWLNDPESDSNNQEFKDLLKNKNYIKVFNKSDISKKPGEISISIKDEDISELIVALEDKLNTMVELKSQTLILQSDRQINYVTKIILTIKELIIQLEQNEPLDLLQTYFEQCIDLFNKILGYSIEYDKLDELFKNFCLGK
ncbi:MAG: tRNA uridine-5-carboxymethylaminomethyl(34) synthesis GTPase MnmE [Mycoplasma sp.]